MASIHGPALPRRMASNITKGQLSHLAAMAATTRNTDRARHRHSSEVDILSLSRNTHNLKQPLETPSLTRRTKDNSSNRVKALSIALRPPLSRREVTSNLSSLAVRITRTLSNTHKHCSHPRLNFPAQAVLLPPASIRSRIRLSMDTSDQHLSRSPKRLHVRPAEHLSL